MTTARVSRDRSAEVKAHIRRSAHRLFTAGGFDGTGIRDIAADAGVNPAIVLRHFVSKENLFLETVDGSAAWQAMLEGPLDGLGFRAVDRVLQGRHTRLQVFGTIVRASGRADVQARLHESMIALFAEPLVSRIDAPDARLRAHLFAAQLVGLMSALAVYQDDFLLHAPVEDVIARYGASLQGMLAA